MRLSLVGDANDGILRRACTAAKSWSRRRRASEDVADQVLAGNAALYGATGGRLFVAGCAGERFADAQQRRHRDCRRRRRSRRAST